MERATKETLLSWSRRGGVTVSVLMEQLVDHVELSDDGLPTWLAPAQEGELPINDA